MTNLYFHIAKYFSVSYLPYLFHSLVYQTLYHFKLRGTNGKKKGDERTQQWSNYNGETGNYTADGLTAENLIAKDPTADLPEPLKFVKRRQLNCIT